MSLYYIEQDEKTMVWIVHENGCETGLQHYCRLFIGFFSTPLQALRAAKDCYGQAVLCSDCCGRESSLAFPVA